MSISWWELTPGRLEYELDALSRAGIAHERDEAAFAHGIIRLNLQVDVEGERFPLVVTFPDLYPYFRFEVEAPTLDLEHHQNPFGKNLCLIGRETLYWDTTDTVAGLLQQQFRVVLETGRSAERETALGREHHQAEPIGVFYPYPASMVVVPFDCAIPDHFDHGTFTVATDGPQGPPPSHFLRGALVELRAANGEQIAGANALVLSAYPGDRLYGNWVRASGPIRHFEQTRFIQEILERYPSARAVPANRVNDGWLQIWGVVFPEEVQWRESGDGWVFMCLFDRKRAGLVQTGAADGDAQTNSPEQAQEETQAMNSGSLYFARAGWFAADGISARAPELDPLRDRTIAQFGVGCLGGPIALEFARSGIGELRILDDDHVDPATVGRWPFGLHAAGLPKVQVIAEFIAQNYPSTRVASIQHRLGATRGTHGEARSDHEVIEQMAAGASILFDATAEVGVQHYLSDVAAGLGIPYVSVVGTYGGWGGEVLCITPGRTEGCWMCYRCAIDDGSIPVAPSDPKGRIQSRGCSDTTFTAAGFDMTQVALMAVRTTVAALCRDVAGGYPEAPWDVLTLTLRDESGQLIIPEFHGHVLRRHARCPRCNEQ